MRATEAGYLAVTPFGIDLTRCQVQKLAALGKPVLIAYDADRPGWEGAERTENQLRKAGVPAVRLSPTPRKDIGEMSAEESRRWMEQQGIRAKIA
jgi:DNA primase